MHSIILNLLSKYDVAIVATKKTAAVNSNFKDNFFLVCLKNKYCNKNREKSKREYKVIAGKQMKILSNKYYVVFVKKFKEISNILSIIVLKEKSRNSCQNKNAYNY